MAMQSTNDATTNEFVCCENAPLYLSRKYQNVLRDLTSDGYDIPLSCRTNENGNECCKQNLKNEKDTAYGDPSETLWERSIPNGEAGKSINFICPLTHTGDRDSIIETPITSKYDFSCYGSSDASERSSGSPEGRHTEDQRILQGMNRQPGLDCKRPKNRFREHAFHSLHIASSEETITSEAGGTPSPKRCLEDSKKNDEENCFKKLRCMLTEELSNGDLQQASDLESPKSRHSEDENTFIQRNSSFYDTANGESKNIVHLSQEIFPISTSVTSSELEKSLESVQGEDQSFGSDLNGIAKYISEKVAYGLSIVSRKFRMLFQHSLRDSRLRNRVSRTQAHVMKHFQFVGWQKCFLNYTGKKEKEVSIPDATLPKLDVNYGLLEDCLKDVLLVEKNPSNMQQKIDAFADGVPGMGKLTKVTDEDYPASYYNMLFMLYYFLLDIKLVETTKNQALDNHLNAGTILSCFAYQQENGIFYDTNTIRKLTRIIQVVYMSQEYDMTTLKSMQTCHETKNLRSVVRIDNPKDTSYLSKLRFISVRKPFKAEIPDKWPAFKDWSFLRLSAYLGHTLVWAYRVDIQNCIRKVFFKDVVNSIVSGKGEPWRLLDSSRLVASDEFKRGVFELPFAEYTDRYKNPTMSLHMRADEYSQIYIPNNECFIVQIFGNQSVFLMDSYEFEQHFSMNTGAHDINLNDLACRGGDKLGQTLKKLPMYQLKGGEYVHVPRRIVFFTKSLGPNCSLHIESDLGVYTL